MLKQPDTPRSHEAAGVTVPEATERPSFREQLEANLKEEFRRPKDEDAINLAADLVTMLNDLEPKNKALKARDFETRLEQARCLILTFKQNPEFFEHAFPAVLQQIGQIELPSQELTPQEQAGLLYEAASRVRGFLWEKISALVPPDPNTATQGGETSPQHTNTFATSEALAEKLKGSRFLSTQRLVSDEGQQYLKATLIAESVKHDVLLECAKQELDELGLKIKIRGGPFTGLWSGLEQEMDYNVFVSFDRQDHLWKAHPVGDFKPGSEKQKKIDALVEYANQRNFYHQQRIVTPDRLVVKDLSTLAEINRHLKANLPGSELEISSWEKLESVLDKERTARDEARRLLSEREQRPVSEAETELIVSETLLNAEIEQHVQVIAACEDKCWTYEELETWLRAKKDPHSLRAEVSTSDFNAIRARRQLPPKSYLSKSFQLSLGVPQEEAFLNLASGVAEPAYFTLLRLPGDVSNKAIEQLLTQLQQENHPTVIQRINLFRSEEMQMISEELLKRLWPQELHRAVTNEQKRFNFTQIRLSNPLTRILLNETRERLALLEPKLYPITKGPEKQTTLDPELEGEALVKTQTEFDPETGKLPLTKEEEEYTKLAQQLDYLEYALLATESR